MNEMRKLMEAATLLEYLMREGESIEKLLHLNVFGDTGHVEDDGIVYGPNDVSWEEGELDPGLQQEWLSQVKPFAKEAGQLKKTIMKIASKGRTLTNAEANAAEDTWYDGSDLYSDLELAFDELPEIWENQIGTIHEILAGEVQDFEDDYAPFGEANQGGKTEHSGAKKGKGAYYGRKKDAKQDSKKNRRKADQAETSLTEDTRDRQAMWAGWTGYADWMHGNDDTKEIANQFHQWLNSKDGYLKEEETVEIIGEGRRFVDSASMVRWMMGALEQMQTDYTYGGDPEELFHDVMKDIDNLVEEMKEAEIKPSRLSPRMPRRPKSSRI